jgi:putative tricarboxylic transport membrane protein
LHADSDPPNRGAGAPGPDRAEVIVAFASMTLGASIFAFAFSIGLGTGYDRIGPRFFPFVVAAGLVGSGALLLRGAFGHARASGETRHLRTGWPAMGTLVLALGSTVLGLERAGFIPTAALLFWLVARAFRSRRPWRDAAVGLSLSALVYVAFTRGLGLALPRGLLDGLF